MKKKNGYKSIYNGGHKKEEHDDSGYKNNKK